MAPARRRWLGLVALGLLLAGLVPALSQLNADFMPKGGKTLLLDVLGATTSEQAVREIVASRHTETEWRDTMAARAKSLSERGMKSKIGSY